jgi:hypothetical protein
MATFLRFYVIIQIIFYFKVDFKMSLTLTIINNNITLRIQRKSSLLLVQAPFSIKYIGVKSYAI